MNFFSIILLQAHSLLTTTQTLVLSANIVCYFFRNSRLGFLKMFLYIPCLISLFRLHTTNFGITLLIFSFTSILLKFPYFLMDYFSHILFFISSYLPPCVLCQIQFTVTPQLGSLLKFYSLSFRICLFSSFFFSLLAFFSLSVLISNFMHSYALCAIFVIVSICL